MHVLKHQRVVVEAVALLVLNLQFYGAVVRARDVELLHLLSREDIHAVFHSVGHH